MKSFSFQNKMQFAVIFQSGGKKLKYFLAIRFMMSHNSKIIKCQNFN